MIQRIQSLWLLLAAVCAFLSLKFSFYSGNILVNNVPDLRNLTGIGLTGNAPDVATATDFVSLLLLAAAGIVGIVTVFLFGNRRTQLRFAVIALLLSLTALVYLFIRTNDFMHGTFSLTAALYFLTPVFMVLAIRGIYQDQKLVRSMDRLR